MDEQNEQRKSVGVSIQSSDPQGLILSTLLELRADVSAMGVLVAQMYAKVYGVSFEAVVAKHAELRKKFALDHAFEIHDRHSKPPE